MGVRMGSSYGALRGAGESCFFDFLDAFLATPPELGGDVASEYTEIEYEDEGDEDEIEEEVAPPKRTNRAAILRFVACAISCIC